MAPVAGVALAHAGTVGLAIEIALVVGVGVVVVAAWARNRGADDRDDLP